MQHPDALCVGVIPCGIIHTPSALWMSGFSRNPSFRSAFTGHQQYYGRIRHPADNLRFRFLIRRRFSHPFVEWGRRGLPKFRFFLSDHVVAHTPKMSLTVCPLWTLLWPQLVMLTPSIKWGLVHLSLPLRGCQCVHLCYNLVICVAHFQVTLSSRLACLRFQSHTDSSLRGLRVLPCSGLGGSASPRTQIE